MILSCFLFGLLSTGKAMAIEEPQYTVLGTDENIELRRYAPMIIAEATVSGDMDKASNKGFKLIADYIFGNNTVRFSNENGTKEESTTEEDTNNTTISMTAPVTITRHSDANHSASSAIDMTAPVTVKLISESVDQQWRVHFVMPSKYTMTSLPIPNNPAVMLTEIPETYYATLRFSGFTGEKKVAEKTERLIAWLAEKNITPISTPALARYNPPWALPFLRRNEVIVRYEPSR
ncbi:SOUL family heme-binding protein [Eionea flava]